MIVHLGRRVHQPRLFAFVHVLRSRSLEAWRQFRMAPERVGRCVRIELSRARCGGFFLPRTWSRLFNCGILLVRDSSLAFLLGNVGPSARTRQAL